jgi:hypothetical protein
MPSADDAKAREVNTRKAQGAAFTPAQRIRNKRRRDRLAKANEAREQQLEEWFQTYDIKYVWTWSLKLRFALSAPVLIL